MNPELKKGLTYLTRGGIGWVKQDEGHVRAGEAPVTNFSHVSGDVWLGTINVFGQSMHFYAIRMRSGEESESGLQEPYNDPEGHYVDFSHIQADGPFETVEIPGLPGEYTLFAYSYVD